MRVYFIFDIKDDFKNIYIGREEYLFIILKSLYELTSKDIDYGYTIQRQITNYINTEVLDRENFDIGTMYNVYDATIIKGLKQ